MASPRRYISEIHVPIRQDSLSFQDRHMKQWEDMESRMQERRKLWEDEFERMRQEFFTLKPSESMSPQPRTSLNLDSGMRSMVETDADGVQRFKARFEVSEFQPDEIQVKVQDNKLNVNAKHEEKSAQTSVSKEYSRQVDIPSCVDQEKMECVLSKDGILSVDAPTLQPQITGSNSFSPLKSSLQDKKLDVATAVKNPIVTEPDGTRKLRLEVKKNNNNVHPVLKSHWVVTYLHKLLSWAASFTSFLVRSFSFKYRWIFSLQDIFGRPLFFFPAEFQLNTRCGKRPFSILTTRSNHLNLLSLIRSVIFLTPILFITLMFVILIFVCYSNNLPKTSAMKCI